MIQAIITYMIIGAAVAFAISKSVKKLQGKKKRNSNVNFQKNKISMQHNCSDCSAECMLRNTATSIKENNKEICNKIELHES